VADLICRAAGRVWISDEAHPAARHTFRTGSGKWRNVGDPPAGAQILEPALEDAYLLLVGEPALSAGIGALS
jgi:ABC-2 type transport system ATP-binding protein